MSTLLARLRPLRFLFPPILLLAAAYVLHARLETLDGVWQDVIPWSPWLLAAVVCWLGWRFNHGHAVLATLIILLLHRLLEAHFPHQALAVQASTLLLPVNFLLLATWRERGLLTVLGLTRIAFILLQAGLLLWLARDHADLLQAWLFLVPDILDHYNPTSLPVLLVTSGGIAVLYLGYRLLRYQQHEAAMALANLISLDWLLLHPLNGLGQSLLIALNLLFWLLLILHSTHEKAYLDELTGLPGRRALNEHLLRLGRRYSIAMLDVDHFKKFNDSYGHDVGDQVLKLVASRLRRVRGGRCYRYGGEEFTVIFPRRHLQQCLPALEELRAAVEDSRLRIRGRDRPRKTLKGRRRRGNTGTGKSVSVTISIGIAENGPGVDALKQADQALYRAKHKGRNQVSR